MTHGERSTWSAPGPEAVAPRTYRIPLPLPNDGLRAVNVYAIETDDGLALIDGGWAVPAAEIALEDALAEIGFGVDEINELLVTHVHRDHYTMAVALRRIHGTRISLGRGDQASLEGLQRLEPGAPIAEIARLPGYGAAALAEQLSGRPTGKASASHEFEDPDHWLDGRATIDLGGVTLTAIPTPGHTAGHYVFRWDAAGVLFSGDHVLPHITPSIGFELVRTADPLGDFLRSLRLLTDMDDLRLLPAHGPAGGSVLARVAELEAHHARRLDLIEAAVDRGASTAFEVACQLPWTRRPRRYDELDLFNQMLAVSETAAHLDFLVIAGRLTVTTDEGVSRYLRP